MKKTIIGKPLPNMPWQDKPAGCKDPVWRFNENPVIDRNPLVCSDRVFNSALVPWNDGYVGVFRADHKNGLPNLHVGWSKDAIDWDIEEEIIHFKNEDGSDGEQIEYGYDPRTVEIDGVYYITWCNSFTGQPTIGVAKTKDFKTFVRMENAFVPFNRNGVLFPRKINGNFVMLNRPSDSGHTPFGDIFLSQSPDMTFWGKHRHVMSPSGNWWKGMKIGPGPIPIETTEGWLMIYHGVCNTCNGYVYSMGAALLDIDDPSKVIADTTDFILTPQEDYETVGFVPNVAFPCASIQDADTGRIAIFYGAADTYCAIAFTQIDELIDFIRTHPMK